MKNNKNLTIVIVEDEPAMKIAINDSFSRNGFTTICASDGKEGLEIILAHKPDLVILDIFMPIMDGKEVMRQLRKDAWGSTVPVLVLTNLSLDGAELVEAMIETSPEYFLLKSDWTLDEIVSKAEKILLK